MTEGTIRAFVAAVGRFTLITEGEFPKFVGGTKRTVTTENNNCTVSAVISITLEFVLLFFVLGDCRSF